MLELNTATTTTDADALIKDGSEQSFMQDVIETSQSVPVIVDFWAPWCGPCKTLGPALEAAVTAAKGAVKMVKLNVDENQRLQVNCKSNPFQPSMHFGRENRLTGFKERCLDRKSKPLSTAFPLWAMVLPMAA